MPPDTWSRRVARVLARLPVFSRAVALEQANRRNFWLSLSKAEKAYLGSYMILNDHAAGEFPPRFDDREDAYRRESDYFSSLPGVDEHVALDQDVRKPFHFQNHESLRHFMKLCAMFDACGVRPPLRVLELGAGTGWLSELLAIVGFEVVATSLGENSMRHIAMRRASVEQKGLRVDWRSFRAPMESVDAALRDSGVLPVDAVFVFEALHHAFSWRETLGAAYTCLRPGGWFFVCNEPNVMHTFVSYRVARLSQTHEVGLSGGEMVAELRRLGFRTIRKFSNRVDLRFGPHWLAAQRP